MVAAGLAVPILKVAGSAIVLAIRELYHIAEDINAWMDSHIQEMQASENLTISRTGRVLEAAKTGFGLGYVASVTVISVGQLLLGNPLTAAQTIGTAAVLANPMAMTCAAVGAIIYGWNALPKDEQQNVLDRISSGLELGIELIKSVINFIISASKEILHSDNVDELKKYVTKVAKAFGRKLGQITGGTFDNVKDLFQSAKELTESATIKTTSVIKDAAQATADTATKAREAIVATLDQNGDGKLGLDDGVEVVRKIPLHGTRKPKAS